MPVILDNKNPSLPPVFRPAALLREARRRKSFPSLMWTSALGQQRSSNDVCVMSATAPTAAQKRTSQHFAFVSLVDLRRLSERGRQVGCPYHVTAAPMGSATDHCHSAPPGRRHSVSSSRDRMR